MLKLKNVLRIKLAGSILLFAHGCMIVYHYRSPYKYLYFLCEYLSRLYNKVQALSREPDNPRKV